MKEEFKREFKEALKKIGKIAGSIYLLPMFLAFLIGLRNNPRESFYLFISPLASFIVWIGVIVASIVLGYSAFKAEREETETSISSLYSLKEILVYKFLPRILAIYLISIYYIFIWINTLEGDRMDEFLFSPLGFYTLSFFVISYNIFFSLFRGKWYVIFCLHIGVFCNVFNGECFI